MAQVAIDTGFPGGNVVVEAIDGDEVRLHQDLRDTLGDWFYWYFRVTGAAGRRLRFIFTASRAIGVRGPAVSLDGGLSWRWLGAEAVDGNSFTCDFGPETDVRFSFGMPYLQANLERFVASRQLPVETLCRSRAGRPVELIRLPGRRRVLITCRHHCCEMMASYAVEGLLEAALDGALGDIGLTVVPFVDKDGVEAGDQGKNRRPHDHNRDYAAGLYPETRAVRRLVADDPSIAAMLDLHCPHIAGDHNESVYIVGSRFPATWERQQRFSACLERVQSGALRYRADDNLPFGVDWNSDRSFAGGVHSIHWAAQLPQIGLAASIELPYANANGAEVTSTSARGFGRDLAAALADYLSADRVTARGTS